VSPRCDKLGKHCRWLKLPASTRWLSHQQSRLANSFSGGGLWQPEAAALAKLRRDIDRKPHRIKLALTDAGIRTGFLKNVANNQDKAVHAFANLATNKSTALKRHPKASLNRSSEVGRHVMVQFDDVSIRLHMDFKVTCTF
jgi:hypothetical protein